MPARFHGPLCDTAAAAGEPRRRAEPAYGNVCPDCYHHTHGTSKQTHRTGAAHRCKNWPACTKFMQKGCNGHCISCFSKALGEPRIQKRRTTTLHDDPRATVHASEPPSKCSRHQPRHTSPARAPSGTSSFPVLHVAPGVAHQQAVAPISTTQSESQATSTPTSVPSQSHHPPRRPAATSLLHSRARCPRRLLQHHRASMSWTCCPVPGRPKPCHSKVTSTMPAQTTRSATTLPTWTNTSKVRNGFKRCST